MEKWDNFSLDIFLDQGHFVGQFGWTKAAMVVIFWTCFNDYISQFIIELSCTTLDWVKIQGNQSEIVWRYKTK